MKLFAIHKDGKLNDDAYPIFAENHSEAVINYTVDYCETPEVAGVTLVEYAPVNSMMSHSNPFQNADGVEGNSTTGYRIEKVKAFTRKQCFDALALELFCSKHVGGWLQVAVKRAINKRLKTIEGAH